MQAQLTVGELAKLAGVSRQTLIYYDREGIFRPSSVNRETGYRYYTADQLETLVNILSLREAGVPLREIRAHMAARTAEGTAALLRSQAEWARAQAEHWQTTARRLERKAESLRRLTASEDDFLTELPAEWLAVEPVGGRRGLADVDVALKRVLRRASDQGLPHFYQLGDTLSAEDLAAGNYLRFSSAFLPLQGTPEGPGIVEKPAGLYGRCFHHGTYETTFQAYDTLLSRMADAGYRPAGGSYEYCVLDSMSSDTPEEYVTEIQIPAKKITETP